MALTLEQKQHRKTGIGGSDVAAIFGLSKWATPLDIFFSKIEEPQDDYEENDAIEWGNRLESLVVKAFEEKTGKKCIVGEETFRHPIHTHMLANIDARIDGENAIVEVKTARFAGEWGEKGSDQIPDSYLFQVAHYSAVLNLDRVYIAVLISGSDFRIYEYTKNVKLETMIIEKTTDFWTNHVQALVPPDPVSSLDSIKLWKSAIPESAKTADEKILNEIDKLKSIRKQIAELEKKEEMNKTNILSYLQDNELLKDGNDNILATWKQQNTARFDLGKFKQEENELYGKYLKQTQSRVFRLNNKGE